MEKNIIGAGAMGINTKARQKNETMLISLFFKNGILVEPLKAITDFLRVNFPDPRGEGLLEKIFFIQRIRDGVELGSEIVNSKDICFEISLKATSYNALQNNNTYMHIIFVIGEAHNIDEEPSHISVSMYDDSSVAPIDEGKFFGGQVYLLSNYVKRCLEKIYPPEPFG